MKLCVLAPFALATGLALSPVVAQALPVTYDFSWSGVGTEGDLLSAFGTLDIDAEPDNSFSDALGSISNVSITVQRLDVLGGVLNSFVFTAWDNASGDVSLDGTQAFFDELEASPVFIDLGSEDFFGCFGTLNCSDDSIGGTPYDHPILVSFGGDDYVVEYASGAAAAASMVMTQNAAAVPLPATLPLAVAGLAGLGWVARRRA